MNVSISLLLILAILLGTLELLDSAVGEHLEGLRQGSQSVGKSLSFWLPLYGLRFTFSGFVILIDLMIS
jgi:hypothetical protein